MCLTEKPRTYKTSRDKGTVVRKRPRALMGLLGCLVAGSAVAGFSPASPPKLRSRTIAERMPRRTRVFLWLDNTIDAADAAAADAPSSDGVTRRRALSGILAASMASLLPSVALAGAPKLDATTGELFAPKAEMLRGGSDLTRGLPLQRRPGLRAGEAVQTVYGPRFVAYLARFLLNFDPAAQAWWRKQGFGDTWEAGDGEAPADDVETVFGAFAESVEIGLADYFTGPYDAYVSLLFLEQATTDQPQQSQRRRGIVDRIFGEGAVSRRNAMPREGWDLAKQGVLNLYALLKARYTSVTAKRQLAILFTFLPPPLQPAPEIAALLGEADNATVTQLEVIRPRVGREAESRTSSRRGGGYSLDDIPTITIDAPPALGADYPAAQVLPLMKATSRVLRIRVVDGGAGYDAAPIVSLLQTGATRTCQAVAILDRSGAVAEVLVLDPGYGYGGRRDAPPLVRIEGPRGNVKGNRRAKAVAELEYEIVGASLLRGGSGYVPTEPPKIRITPPQDDPDWYLVTQELPELRMVPVQEPESLQIQVAEMRSPDGNIAFSVTGVPERRTVDDDLLIRLIQDPLEMLPSSIRPQRMRIRQTGEEYYSIPALDEIPQSVVAMDPRYRSFDPVFGGIGIVPVQIGATQLSASEYARLALSGAVCTVVVRTALNPLELIKTKQQLGNDVELFEYARQKKLAEIGSLTPFPSNINDDNIAEANSIGRSIDDAQQTQKQTQVAVLEKIETNLTTTPTEVKVGTIDLIKSMIDLRGPFSLFQSADITFLASIAFGSFGFGATELFRRLFTAAYFGDGDVDNRAELVLLGAAAVATIVTAAVASPLELLRVRSMGQLEPQSWKAVLNEFVNKDNYEDMGLRKLKPRDLLPLWAGFSPTLSRELPFALAKFLTFDLLATTIVDFLNAQIGQGALPVQVGVGPVGLTVSALSGAVAGIAGAIVSHPADLILTKTTSAKRQRVVSLNGEGGGGVEATGTTESNDWRAVVKDLISQDGGVANLFIGLGARSTFFFLVIGLQFFLYDYVKNLFQVGSDDLNLVLDVFYAVRAGLAPAAD